MVFQEAIQKLSQLGFYDFLLPFIIFSAILYAILRKTKILGESPLINGILSIAVSLFVFSVPALAGVSLAKPLAGFFTQFVVVVLIIAFGLLVTGLFVPNVMEKMVEWIKGGGIVWWMIILVLIVATTSGLFSFIVSPMMKAVGSGRDIFIALFFIGLFIVIIATVSGGGKK